MRRICCALILLAAAAATAPGAVFQYGLAVRTSRGEREGFLWVPPKAERIRGVVLGGMTLMEREFARDPAIRQACAAEGLAIVFLKTGLGSVDVGKVLDDAARVSGYGELSAAPLLFVGHSAGGPQAKACAVKFASRCFGLVQYRGGAPGGGGAVPAGVPALMMLGQFDEFGGTMRSEAGRETWEGGRDALAAYRAAGERNLGSVVVEPGAGHFAWSDRNAAYLAMFLGKAARARIPASGPAGAAGPPALRRIDPRTGWLTDLTISAPGKHAPAPYAKYTGDKARAAWHFDEEIARATAAYHAGGFGKKDQFVKWDDPYWVDAGARFFFTRPTWVGDGRTLEVHPAYAEAYPSQYNGRGPRWPKAGQPVGHAKAPIRLRIVGGPAVVTGPGTLRLQHDALAPVGEGARVTFLACSPGDAEFRYTEHVGMLPRGFKGFSKGTGQVIAFPQPPDLTVGGKPVALKAASSAAVPVDYYVAHGPAKITGGKITLAELPARAKFPLTVKIVAYQLGRGLEPLVKTAAPVERTIRILKP